MPAVDLAVIGAGPAGSTAAALAARRGFSVLLLERHAAGAERVCGELVATEATATLAYLVPDLVEGSIHVGEARLHLGHRSLDLRLEPRALAIPRTALDRSLFEAAARSGARCLEHAEVVGIDGAGPFQVRTPSESFGARAVIDAAGRWSRFSRRSSDWIGLKATFHEPQPRPGVDLFFFEGGYCGAQPVGQELLDVAAAVRRRTATRLSNVFALEPGLLQRSRSWSAVGPQLATAPLAFGPAPAALGNVLKAGDAAGFVDPFLGQGIATAILTGRAAVETLWPFLEGRAALSEVVAAWRARHRRMTRRLFALGWLARQGLEAPPRMRELFGAAVTALGPQPVAWARTFAAAR